MKFKMPAITLLIGIPLMLSGCGLWGGSQQSDEKKADKQQDVNLIKDNKSLDDQKGDHKKEKSDQSTSKKDKKKADTVERQLFLMDKNGMVVPQTMMLPKTASVAKQSLQYLVKDGPVSNMLPDGFQAVLPAGTEVEGVNLKGNTLTVNFSKEFKGYKSENEQKILQAVTWTATQFDDIDHVKIQMNGAEQATMPVNDTPIAEEGASREDGINEETSDVVDITDSQAMTLYFPAQAGENYYYVPVTQRMNVDKKGKITAAVEGLIKGPAADSGLLGEFREKAGLKGEPKIQDGVVTLNFNDAIYSSTKKKIISDEALNTLVLSLTAQDGIKKVAIKVDGDSAVKNEAGEAITEPVSRPKQVNTVGL